MTRTRSLSLLALLLLACPADEGDDEVGTSAEPTTGESQETGTTETGGDPVCTANGGAYGPCSESLCQCVLGGDVYQYCTKSCAETSECGDPSEFPGAVPDCAPVNPGEADMICVLRCNADADCPCGLECDSTYLLCSEPQ